MVSEDDLFGRNGWIGVRVPDDKEPISFFIDDLDLIHLFFELIVNYNSESAEVSIPDYRIG